MFTPIDHPSRPSVTHATRDVSRRPASTSHDFHHHHRRRRRPRPRRRVHERTVTFTTSPWTNHPRSTTRLQLHGRCTPLSHTPSRVPPPRPTHHRRRSRARSTPGAASTRVGAGSLNPIHTLQTHVPSRSGLDAIENAIESSRWFSKDGFRDRDVRGATRGDRPVERPVGRGAARRKPFVSIARMVVRRGRFG